MRKGLGVGGIELGALVEVGPREDIEDLVGTAADQVESVEGEGRPGTVPNDHPVGPYGHGSGTMLGMTETLAFVPGTGEDSLHPNTVYAMEFSVVADVPEWGGVEVSMGLEEQAVVTAQGARFLDGYPKSFYLIR